MEKLIIGKLGDNIEEGTISSIFFKIGDQVNSGDVFLEMETDKTVLDIVSDKSGVIEKLNVKPGDKIKPGETYAEIKSEKQDSAEKQSLAKKSKSNTANKDNAADESSASSKNVNLVKEKEKEKVKDQEVQKIKNKEVAASSKRSIIVSKIPNLGDSVDQASLVKITVKIGDIINKGDIVAELESDKANFELESFEAGTILEILVSEGDIVKSGQDLFKLEQPKGEGILIDDESQSGVNDLKDHQNPDTSAPTNIRTAPDFVQKTKPVLQDQQVETRVFYSSASLINASPHVRRFAREIGIDLSQVLGSGKNDRISIEDLKNYAKNINQNINQKQNSASKPESTISLPDFSAFGSLERIKLGAIKKTTARHMAYLWPRVPAVTHFDKANIEELEKLRKLNKPLFKAKQVNLTITPILIKIMAIALKEFPVFNASYDEVNLEIVIKKYYNIGVAVDTESGLLVPVIKQADSKSVLEIALELDSLSKKARDRKLKPDELTGASFTISNLGGIAGNAFTPIVNWPEVAILGVAKGKIEPVFDGQNFKPFLHMPLCLSYDHRVIDGAESARFLKRVVELLEQPFQIALL